MSFSRDVFPIPCLAPTVFISLARLCTRAGVQSHTPFAATVACQTSGLAATPRTPKSHKTIPKRSTSTTSPLPLVREPRERDGHPLRRPLKEMDIHYVALPPPTGPEATRKRWTSTTSPRNPDRKPPEREGHPLRRLLTPRPPPPSFDFGQSDRVRERDFEIAPKFAVPGPLLRS